MLAELTGKHIARRPAQERPSARPGIHDGLDARLMNIRPIQHDEIEAARHLLAANNWGKRVADAAVFAQLIERSQIALVAVEDGQVIGFLRAITDGLFNGYPWSSSRRRTAAAVSAAPSSRLPWPTTTT